MQLSKLVLIGVAFLALACFVQAADNFYVAWGPGNVYFETWDNGYYAYAASPWAYSYNDYYYFPSNFRFSYLNSWYEYPAGWYYSSNGSYFAANAYWAWQDGYWYNSQYNYYYYPNAYWNGPVYYNSIDPYVYTYPVVSPTVAQVKPVPSCGEIDIRTQTVYAGAGETASQSFDVENNSPETFYIQKTEWASPSLSIWSAGFDSKVTGNDSAQVQFNAESEKSGMFGASVAVKGYFASGKQCGFEDTRENFSFIVNQAQAENVETVSASAKVEVPQTQTTSSAFSLSDIVNAVKEAMASTSTVLSLTSAYETTSTPTNCSDIEVQAENVSVVEGETAYVPIIVKNNGSKWFSINSAIVQEDSGLFNAVAQNANIRVNAQSEGSFNIAINALDGKHGSGTVALKISGYFQDGNSCAFNRIASPSFTVSVQDNGVQDLSGLSVKVLAPENFEVNQSGSYWMALVNEFDESIVVRLSGSQVIVDPVAIALGANEVKNVLVTVSNLKDASAWVIYDVQVPEKGMQSTLTKIIQTSTPSPSPTPQPSALNVQLNAKVSSNWDGSYDVNVVVGNYSNAEQTGEIVFLLPAGWKAEGSRNISLSEGKTASVNVRIVPDKANSETRTAIVQFVNANGQKVSKTISFAPNANGLAQAIGAAFAVLGGNLLWLGVLVIALLLVYGFYNYRQEQKAKAQVIKLNWASH
ncbi:MAG: hypothetical protein V1847_00580 [Candidatus Diapherotrites archaeon]